MTPLRSDKEVALDDLLLACQEASNRYEAAAGLCENKENVNWFLRRADQCNKHSQDLVYHIMQEGETPLAPDPERELIAELWLKTKALVLDKGIEEAFKVGLATEEKLVDSAEAVLRHDVSEALKEMVQAIGQEATHTQASLRSGLQIWHQTTERG